MKIDPDPLICKINQIFDAHPHPPEAFGQILDLLGTKLGGDLAVFWQVTENPPTLRPTNSWVLPTRESPQRADELKNRTLYPAEGMPGKVWRTRKAFWSRDISKDMMIPRSLIALAQGYQFGMWIPVMRHEDVYGVIEILRVAPLLDKEKLVEFMRTIGQEIGRRLI